MDDWNWQKNKIRQSAFIQKLAVTEALKDMEKGLDTLSSEIEQIKKDNKASYDLAKVNHKAQLQESAAKKEAAKAIRDLYSEKF